MKKYCSECKKPLENPRNAICDKCGKKTVPTAFYERFSSIAAMDKKDKNMLHIIGIANIVTGVMTIIQIFMLLEMLEANVESLTYSLSKGFLPDTGETRQMVSSAVSSAQAANVVGVVLMIAELFFALLGVLLVMKISFAIKTASIFYAVNIVLYLVPLNIMASVMLIYGFNFLPQLIAADIVGVTASLFLLIEMRKLVKKLKSYDAHTKEYATVKNEPTPGWQCNICGYLNPDSLSECKSCGKYK